MAARFWVGGTGTWNTTSTANWSATSGGAAGASAPTSVDTVNFDANSGSSYTVTISEDVTVFSVTCHTAVSLTFAFGTSKILVEGDNGIVWRNVGTNTYTGTPRVDFTYSGATGTRSIMPGGAASNPLNVYVTAGTDIVALTTGSPGIYGTLDLTGFAGTLSHNGTLLFYGDYILSTGVTLPSNTGVTYFSATTGPKTIKCAGKTIGVPVIFNGVGGSWQFADDFTMALGRTFTLTNGLVDANNKNVTVGNFNLGVGTKTLTLGSGTWTVLNTNWNAVTNNANLTVSPSTGTISMVDSIANKAFNGGGFTWPTLNIGTSVGSLSISQSNTFANITNTVSPATIRLQAGTTQTVTNFSLSGTAGNLVTLNCLTAGSTATLSDTTGTNSVSYLNIKDIVATGGATWEAYTTNGNVDGGNNTGWVFNTAPTGGSQTSYDLRSFTEKRRF